jgi:hypothetical protein
MVPTLLTAKLDYYVNHMIMNEVKTCSNVKISCLTRMAVT